MDHVTFFAPDLVLGHEADVVSPFGPDRDDCVGKVNFFLVYRQHGRATFAIERSGSVVEHEGQAEAFEAQLRLLVHVGLDGDRGKSGGCVRGDPVNELNEVFGRGCVHHVAVGRCVVKCFQKACHRVCSRDRGRDLRLECFQEGGFRRASCEENVGFECNSRRVVCNTGKSGHSIACENSKRRGSVLR